MGDTAMFISRQRSRKQRDSSDRRVAGGRSAGVRWCAVWLFSAVAVLCWQPGRLRADEKPLAQEGPEQRGLIRAIEETALLMEQEQWLAAAESFDAAWSRAVDGDDTLLDQRGVANRQLAPGATDLQAGGRSRLERLYADSGPEFRREFASQFDEVARGSISRAVETRSARKIRAAVLRHQFSAAASRGFRILCQLYLDRGDLIEAALILEQLRGSVGGDSDQLRVLNAWCYAQAQLLDDADELLQMVEAKESLSTEAAQLFEQIQQLRTAAVDAPGGLAWLQAKGNYRRLGRHVELPLLRREQQSQNLFETVDVLYEETLNPLLGRISDWLRKQLEQARRNNYITVTTATPLYDGQRVFFRTAVGVRAIDAATGKLQWEAARPDRFMKMELNADQNINAGGFFGSQVPALNRTLRVNTASQMSISGTTLFAVEDTDVLRVGMSAAMFNGSRAESFSNYIRAYDTESGLFQWEIGGQSGSDNTALNGSPNLLAGYAFLGAPLVLGDRIYVLTESGDGIMLVRVGVPNADAGQLNPQVEASQLLAIPNRDFNSHPLRRYAGLIPSFARGLLICPLCDDRIVAVSAEDLSIRWVFRYEGVLKQQEIGGNATILFGARSPADSDRVDLQSRWADSLPRVAGNRIFVTPRDADQLYCLDLQTGRQLWKTARGGSHAIAAVTADLVVLSGNREVTALNPANGAVMWKHQLRQGQVCGTAACDGRLLYLPVDTPGIVALELATGRRLLIQDWVGPDLPGNLLATSHGLFSQSPLALTRVFSGSGDATPGELAAAALAAGQPGNARKILEDALDANPNDSETRTVLIDVLLILLDDGPDRDEELSGRIEELLRLAARDVEVAPLIHSLLGMSPVDAAGLGRLMRGDATRQREELLEILARQGESDDDVSFGRLQEQVLKLVQQYPEAMKRSSSRAGVSCRLSEVLAGSVRRSVFSRTAEEQIRLQKALAAECGRVLWSFSEAAEREYFLSSLIRSGLPLTAEILLRDETVSWAGIAESQLREQALLSISRISHPAAAEATMRLLQDWTAAGDLRSARAFAASFSEPAGVTEEAAGDSSGTMIPKLLRQDFPSLLLPETDPWFGKPDVKVSDDRTMQNTPPLTTVVPHRPIPLYGPSELYRGVRLTWMFPENHVAAWDGFGRLLWTFESAAGGDSGSGGYRSESWAFSTGRLLLLHLRGRITVLDGTRPKADGTPVVLWEQVLDDDRSSGEQPQFLQLEDRIARYSNTPAGHDRVGPPTVFGVPVISDQRLLLLDLYSGERLWELDGIAVDSRVLVERESLLVLSASARSVEVRSLIDGSLLETSRLPVWWEESCANAGSSIQDIEPEENVDTLWQVDAQGRRSVVFRVGGESSALEARNIVTDQLLWSIRLPRNTVVSNVIEGTLAVLAEGRLLKMVNVGDGRVLVEHEIQPMADPRMLYLQQSGGRWLILPEALSEEDPGLDDFFPLLDAVHVHGTVCAVNQQTRKLDWQQRVRHRQVRLLACNQTRPLLPAMPVLPLLSRGRASDGNGFGVVIGAVVLDVRTGETVYESDNTGRTQNQLWLTSGYSQREVRLSFDRRTVTFKYGEGPAEGVGQDQ